MEASAAPMPVRFDRHPSSNGTPTATAAEPVTTLREEPEDATQVLGPIEAPQPYRISGVTMAALASVVGLAAIALGTWAFATSVREQKTVEIIRTAPIYGAAQAISLLSKPGTERIPVRGSRGSAVLAVSTGGQGLLVLDGLGLAPVGTSYHAWAFDPSTRPFEHIPAGTFTGVETVVPLTARLPRGFALGVTIERARGVPAPTKPFRLLAQRPAA